MGQPVPWSHLIYYRDFWLVQNLWLARLATDVYVRLRYRQLFVPDPTERLVGKMREFVEGNGTKFLVGIQHHDDALVKYLEANRIPFAKLEGAPFYQEAIGVGSAPDARGPESRRRTHFWHADNEQTRLR